MKMILMSAAFLMLSSFQALAFGGAYYCDLGHNNEWSSSSWYYIQEIGDLNNTALNQAKLECQLQGGSWETLSPVIVIGQE